MWKFGVVAWLAILFVPQTAVAAESYELQQLEQRLAVSARDLRRLRHAPDDGRQRPGRPGADAGGALSAAFPPPSVVDR